MFHGLWYYHKLMQVLLAFYVGLCNTFLNSKIYVMEPKGLMGYPKRGSACELSSFRHEQYPSNSPNQNNWAHGVCILPQNGIDFLIGFGIVM